MPAPSRLSRRLLAILGPALCLAVSRAPLRAEGAEPPTQPTPPAAEASLAAPLIPRVVLFGLPDAADAGISPDGKQISFLAPVDGVMNLWVAPFGKMEAARPVTKLKGHGLSTYCWTYSPKYLLFLRDHDGDENNHVYRLDLATLDVMDLTPQPNIDADIIGASPRHPDEILLGWNGRNAAYDDIYRVNLATGDSQRLLKNNKYEFVLADDDLKPRVGVSSDGPEGLDVGRGPATAHAPMPHRPGATRQLPAFGSIVAPGLPAFDNTGEYVYILFHNSADKTSVARVRFKNGETKILADGQKADIVNAVMSPVTKSVLAVWEYSARQQYQVVDDASYADFDVLVKKLTGEFYVSDQTLDDRYWIIANDSDRSPGRYYVFDRTSKTLTLLFDCQPSLAGVPLSPMLPLEIPARDGLKMVSYLTLPPGTDADEDGRPDKPLPMVLWVHGGPSARDTWGYNPVHQWLANRGYAVLSVNYRGSTGFGRTYEDSGLREWGGKMQADLDDATDWAIKEGIADPKRVAIGGASYGGYAALCGLTMNPEKYACGIDICGPSNLLTLIRRNQAPYYKVDIEEFKERVGDPESKRGREFLLSRSPLTHAEAMKRPLLIGQGSNDPRVDQSESDQFVKALEGKPVPLTYLVYPDEGHGFSRPENDISFYAVMEAFLAKHLGGRAEPIGSALRVSSAKVVTGADAIPGLPEALDATPGAPAAVSRPEAPKTAAGADAIPGPPEAAKAGATNEPLALLKRAVDAHASLGPVTLESKLRISVQGQPIGDDVVITVQRNDLEHSFTITKIMVGRFTDNAFHEYVDGDTRVTYNPKDKEYGRSPDEHDLFQECLDAIRAGLLYPDQSKAWGSAKVKAMKFEGAPAHRITVKDLGIHHRNHPDQQAVTLTIDDATGFVRESEISFPEEVTMRLTTKYRPESRPFPDSTFVFVAPPGAKESKPGKTDLK